jgi:hypothetical protein
MPYAPALFSARYRLFEPCTIAIIEAAHGRFSEGATEISVADTSATFPDGLKMILDATFIADAGG